MIDDVPACGHGRPNPSCLTEQQVEALFEAIGDNLRERALFRVMYHRGLRAREVGLLQVSDWNNAESSLLVHRIHRSSSGRYPLVPVEAQAVRSWIRERGTASGPLFPSRNHRPLSKRQTFNILRRFCQMAGIPQDLAHPHVLRHSCGMHLMDRLRNVRAVKDWLGLKSMSSAMIYLPRTADIGDLREVRDGAVGLLQSWGKSR